MFDVLVFEAAIADGLQNLTDGCAAPQTFEWAVLQACGVDKDKESAGWQVYHDNRIAVEPLVLFSLYSELPWETPRLRADKLRPAAFELPFSDGINAKEWCRDLLDRQIRLVLAPRIHGMVSRSKYTKITKEFYACTQRLSNTVSKADLNLLASLIVANKRVGEKLEAKAEAARASIALSLKLLADEVSVYSLAAKMGELAIRLSEVDNETSSDTVYLAVQALRDAKHKVSQPLFGEYSLRTTELPAVGVRSIIREVRYEDCQTAESVLA